MPDPRAHAVVTAGDLWAIRAAITPEGRPVLVNHWATWCDPCQEELPALIAAHRRYGDRVAFVGVAWEAFAVHDSLGAAVRAVEAACEESGMPWREIVADGPPHELIEGLELQWDVIPQTYLLDAAGRVRFSHVGAVTLEELAQAIDAVLDGRS